MKKTLAQFVIIIISLLLLNMPLFLLSKRTYISQEQPDFPATFKQRLEVADKTLKPMKQLLTASENGLNGFSVLIFNSKIFKKQTIRLQLYAVENLDNPIINQVYSLKPNYLFSTASLIFNKIPESQNKQYIVIISQKDTPKGIIRENLKNKDYLLNARPLYKTKSILTDAYFRISQYKPAILKNPTLIIVYIVFNIIFLFLIKEMLKKEKSE